MPRLAHMMVSLGILVSCKTDNFQSCDLPANASQPACIDGGSGAGPCKKDPDCASTQSTPVCDTMKAGGTCVQCMSGSTAQCMGLTPRCDLTAETCVACVDDADCGTGGVCLPTGGCADPTKIIHAVSTGGATTMNTCGGIGAGNACDLDTAIAVARSGTGTKNVIKLDDVGPYVSTMNNFLVDVDANFNLTIDARGAALHRTVNGPILTIPDNKGVTLLGGTIEGATAPGGDGIQCHTNGVLTIQDTTIRGNDEIGINASSCKLTITSANIQDNSKATGAVLSPGVQVTSGSITMSRSRIISNRGGGIVVSNNGKFVIVGSLFLSNGDISTGPVGGALITTSTPGNRLDFNTFTDNRAPAGVLPGIQCSATAGFMAQNNIVWNNLPAGAQVFGTCGYAYSDIGPTTTTVSGTGNLKDDPLLTIDGHLGPGSAAIGKADMNADLLGLALKDIDGHVRVPPADLGAFQVPR